MDHQIRRCQRFYKVLSPWEWAVLCALLVCYFMNAATTVLGGDNGEFLTVGNSGGVPHPSGYPAYVLYLQAMSWFPGSNPVHVMSLATALLGVASAFFLGCVLQALNITLLTRIFSLVLYGFSGLVVQMNTHAEVFALNNLVAVIIIWLSVCSRFEGCKRVFLLAFVGGAGLSNHLSIVLLAPIGIYGIYRGFKEAPFSWSTPLYALLFLALGLSPYLYFFYLGHYPGEAGWVWGETDTFSGLLHHFLRADFGTMSLGLSTENAASFGMQVVALSEYLVHAFLVLPFILGLIGGLRFIRGEWAERMLLLSLIASGPVFVALFNVRLIDLGARIVERFYFLPMMLFTLLVAAGFEWFYRLLVTRSGAGVAWGRRLGVVLVACVFLVQLERATETVGEHHRPTISNYLVNTLESLPENSALLVIEDYQVFGFLYLQEVLEIRRDVTVISPLLLHYPWYQERIEGQLMHPITGPEGDTVDTVRLVSELMERDSPVFLAHLLNGVIQEHFPTYPYGTTVAVLPAQVSPPTPWELEAENLRLFEGFRLESEPPTAPNTWAGAAQLNYARPWRTLAQAFSDLGDDERRQANRDRANALVPWLGLE